MKIRGLYIKLGLNQILNKNTRNSKILNKMMKSLTWKLIFKKKREVIVLSNNEQYFL